MKLVPKEELIIDINYNKIDIKYINERIEEECILATLLK